MPDLTPDQRQLVDEFRRLAMEFGDDSVDRTEAIRMAALSPRGREIVAYLASVGVREGVLRSLL